MKYASIAAALVAVAFAAPAVHAQAAYKKDIPEALAKQAKITEDAAAAAALKRIPQGRIEAVELEKEKGKLLYSYDIKTEGKAGIDEVHVSAVTGKILSVVHESPAAEKKEAAEDAKAAKAKAATKTKKP